MFFVSVGIECLYKLFCMNIEHGHFKLIQLIQHLMQSYDFCVSTYISLLTNIKLATKKKQKCEITMINCWMKRLAAKPIQNK